MTGMTVSKARLPLVRPLPRRIVGALQIAAALIPLAFTPGEGVADGIVRQLSGTVEIGRGEPPVWGPAEVDARVAPLDRIRTGGDGRVELVLEAGTLRLHENSLLRLPPASPEADRVELETGHSLFDVLRRGGRLFEVHTPSVVVSVKGTRFGVESSGGRGVVSVYRGEVGVRASDADALVETLVREGFLAVGGGDLPIELDVAPEGDPWLDWQDLRTSARNTTDLETPGSDVERARTSLRRATDGDVLERAAQRKPEIAERLRQLTSGNRTPAPTPAPEATTRETRSNDGNHPASPGVLDTLEAGGGSETRGAGSERDALDSKGDAPESDGRVFDTKGPADDALDSIRVDDLSLDRERQGGLESLDENREGLAIGDSTGASGSLREVVEMQRAETALVPVETSVDIPSLTGGAPLANGETEFSTDHLADFDPRDVMRLMNALQDMQEASGSLARPWTDGDMASFLEAQLVAQGMDAIKAAAMVQGLFQ